MYMMIICHCAILYYNMSFKTIAWMSGGVFWWFPALSEDQENNCGIHQNYLVALTTVWFVVQSGIRLHTYRDDDFPRSRKTDGKHGINPWKQKTYFQTEKHGNVLLTTCCTEICNKSYQIQRKKNDFAFIHALKSIAEWYRPSHASCHVHVTLPWP